VAHRKPQADERGVYIAAVVAGALLVCSTAGIVQKFGKSEMRR